MNIAQFAVSKPITNFMRIGAFVLMGLVCLSKLSVDLLPRVSIPTITVSTNWPNVAPEEIETLITRPLEEQLSSVDNLYCITSTTTEGNSSVRIQFQWGADIGQAAVDTLQLVERAQRNFPTNDPTLETPLVFKFDPSQIPILVFAVSGEKDSVKLRTLLDNQITPIIESANGVAAAMDTGGDQRAIIVDVDPVKMAAFNLSLQEINDRSVAENVNLPAGIGKQGQTEYTVRSLGWFTSVKDMASIPLTAPNGQVVRLGDVASVRDEHTETRIFTRSDGGQAVGMSIVQQTNANTIATKKAVYEKLALVQKLYPNLKFKVAYDQAMFIQQSITDLGVNALIGGLLAVLILLFFLRNVRSTLVVATSIPASIISTFFMLFVCGFTINTMSLGGISLATGLIVDDAVVVLENIFRHIERDKQTPRDAAISGTTEIVGAVFASTWTVMVVFLPLLLIKGQAGQMFTQFAMVVIFSLGLSLMDATTVVPILASFLISGEAHAELNSGKAQRGLLNRAFAKFGDWFTALDAAYRQLLAWALHHRFRVLGAALLITLASLCLIPQLGTEMMPLTDSGDLSVSIKLPPGTALATTDGVMRQVEAIIKANPNVETAYSAIGAGNVQGSSVSAVPFWGAVTVHLKDKRTQSTAQVIEDMRKKFSVLAGVRPQVMARDLVSQLMTGGTQNVEVDIFGTDLGKLSAAAQDLIGRIRDIRGLENLDVNWQEAMPEIQWKVDRDKATQLGVSFSDVANTIETATDGTSNTNYQENGFAYPIYVQMPEATRKTVAQMSSIVIVPTSPTASAKQVFLSQVATPIYAMGPSQITRFNRQRYIAVTGTPTNRSAGEVQADIQKRMADFETTLPSGYYWDWGINQKRQVEEFSGMWVAVLLAIALIYMLLASQFESLIHPLTVLCSVPLAITGVILALFLTNRSLGLTAFIGILMLVGIVVKNGILLVDYTNQLRERGLERERAILTAAPTRLRPILMTASAAMLGMFPIALALGRGSETNAPMATAVIGGLMTSTALTLLVVPVVYSVFDDIALALRRRSSAQTVEVEVEQPEVLD